MAHVFILGGTCLLLLLVMSNLLLCQGYPCPDLCPDGDELCRATLRDLFTRATILSNDMYNHSVKMFDEFVSTVVVVV